MVWWIEFENRGHSTAYASEAGGMGDADGLPNPAIAKELATPTGISPLFGRSAARDPDEKLSVGQQAPGTGGEAWHGEVCLANFRSRSGRQRCFRRYCWPFRSFCCLSVPLAPRTTSCPLHKR